MISKWWETSYPCLTKLWGKQHGNNWEIYFYLNAFILKHYFTKDFLCRSAIASYFLSKLAGIYLEVNISVSLSSFIKRDDRTVFHLTAMITTLNSLSDNFPPSSLVFYYLFMPIISLFILGRTWLMWCKSWRWDHGCQ